MSDLRVSGLSKRYGRTQALADVSLRAPSGSRMAVVGPSGSGKSTLLRLIAGFDRPDAGEIDLGADRLVGAGVMRPAHRRNIGIVSQDGALFPHLDIGANIAFGIEAAADRSARVLEMFDIVQLDRALISRYPHELSGGQQQRVALARALARKPRLMLLDEPFSALDAGLRQSVRQEVIQTLERVGIGSILVTHDHSEALSFADQIAVMRDGRLVQAGTPRELYARPVDAKTALMLGDAVILDGRMSNGIVETLIGSVRADSGRAGAVQIMLRPEQISVLPALDERRPPGVVTHSEFEGSTSTLIVAFQSSQGEPFELAIRQPSALALPVGSRVVLDVSGYAHVLA
jgi:iron(III) transport system ATP-binding protein